MADAPLKITIRPAAAVTPDTSTGDFGPGAGSAGLVDASTFLGTAAPSTGTTDGTADSGTSAAPSTGTTDGTADSGTSAAPATKDTGTAKLTDAADFLAAAPAPPKLTPDMTNDQILSTVGYNADDIAKLKTDPLYKLAATTDGDNFLAKEVSTPGSVAQVMQGDPNLGGFIRGAGDTGLTAAKYMALGLNKIGALPDTTPAMLDAANRVSEAAYQQARAPQLTGSPVVDSDTISRFLGSLALPSGAAGAAADATVAAGQAVPVASRLMQAGASIIKPAAIGAASAPMFNSHSEIAPSVGPDYNKAYAATIGKDAEWGASFAAGTHLLVKGALAAGGVVNKVENAARIKKVLDTLKAGMGNSEQKYKDIVSALEPMFKDPEYADREASFAANNVKPSLGDISQSGFAKRTESAGRNLPLGMGKFRDKTQQGEVQTAAKKFSAEYYDRMINTKWGSLTELEDAAKGQGDYAKRAQQVLDILKEETGTEASRVIKADLGAQDVRNLLIKAKLYAKRDALAGDALVDNRKPKLAVDKAIKELSDSAIPNKGLTSELGQISSDLANGAPSQRYNRYVNTRNAVGDLIGKYGDNADRHLINIKNAYDEALDDFAKNATKYAKANADSRFGITAKNTAPAFKRGLGGGYEFDAMRPQGAADVEPGIRLYADSAAAKAANVKGPFDTKTVKLRSPIIVDGPQGLADFKAAIGLPDTASAEDVTKAAVAYAKGKGNDGIVFSHNGVPRQVIDMVPWKKEIGEVDAKAKKFVAQNYAPQHGQGGMMAGKQDIVSQALRAQPDQVVKGMIQAGQTDKAKTFFNALGPRGQAAVRSQLIDDAIKAGTDEDGKVSPAKVYSKLFKIKDQANVFFKGEDKWRLEGFLKLMEHAEQAGPAGHGGGHIVGQMMVIETIEAMMHGLMSGELHTALIDAAVGAAAIPVSGATIRAVATSPKIRHYLLAASDAAPGSVNMDKIYQKFKSQVALVAADASKAPPQATRQEPPSLESLYQASLQAQAKRRAQGAAR